MRFLIIATFLSWVAASSYGQNYVFMKMGCRQGTASGCYHYARHLYREGKKDDARRFLTRACSLGHNRSCEGPDILEIDAEKAWIDPTILAEREKKKKEEEKKKKVGQCDDITLRLGQCSKFQCQNPHLLVEGFDVTYTIVGFDDGKCIYEETLPNNGMLHCTFRKSHLKKFEDAGIGIFGLNEVLGSMREDISLCRTDYTSLKKEIRENDLTLTDPSMSATAQPVAPSPTPAMTEAPKAVAPAEVGSGTGTSEAAPAGIK